MGTAGAVSARIVVEPYATMLILGARAFSASRTADDDLRSNAARVLDSSNVTGLVRTVAKETLLFIVGVIMTVVVLVCMLVIVFVVMAISRAVRVAMATEDEETDEIGEETGASNSEDELRAVDLRGFDESGESLENDGHAKSDKEDGVEESTKDFGANPLQKEVSMTSSSKVDVDGY